MWAFIETPRGVLKAGEICETGTYKTIALGANDLSAEMKLPLTLPASAAAAGVSRRFGLFAAMSQIVLAARANNLHVLDGVFNDLNDSTGFARECAEGKLMGFDGKTLIHPSQIDTARSVFGNPAEAELKWARRVLQEVDDNPEAIGAISVEGKLVEELHIRRAAEIVAQHESSSKESQQRVSEAKEGDEQNRMYRQTGLPKRQGQRDFDYLKNQRWDREDPKARMPPR